MNESVPSSFKLLLGLLFLGLALSVAAVLWWSRGREAPVPRPRAPDVDQQSPLTAEQAHELIRTAQLANGHLENVDLAKADVLYSEIVELLPSEPLGVRNQAICRYLLLDQQKIDMAAVQAALARLQQLEPNAPSTYWLLGKTAAKGGIAEAATAADHFQHAAELSADPAVYWYEAYDAARVMPDGDARAK